MCGIIGEEKTFQDTHFHNINTTFYTIIDTVYVIHVHYLHMFTTLLLCVHYLYNRSLQAGGWTKPSQHKEKRHSVWLPTVMEERYFHPPACKRVLYNNWK